MTKTHATPAANTSPKTNMRSMQINQLLSVRDKKRGTFNEQKASYVSQIVESKNINKAKGSFQSEDAVVFSDTHSERK